MTHDDLVAKVLELFSGATVIEDSRDTVDGLNTRLAAAKVSSNHAEIMHLRCRLLALKARDMK